MFVSFMLLPQEQGAIPVTQKSEIVFQCIFVDFLPVISHPGRNQEEQGAFRQMKVRNDPACNFEIITGNYNYPGWSVKMCKIVPLHPFQNCLQGLPGF